MGDVTRTGARRHLVIPRRIGETHSFSTARIRGITSRHDFITWSPFRMSVMEGGVLVYPAALYAPMLRRLVQQDRRNDQNMSYDLQN
jgi:hypothetical protein